MAEPLLQVADLHVYLGESHVLQGIGLEVQAGEAVAVLGRNGAGKTTAMRTLMGLVAPRAGWIRFRGEDITTRSPHLRVRAGLAYAPQDRRMFSDLTVEHNLEVAEHAVSGNGGRQRIWSRADLYELFPVLHERRWQLAGRLSGGEQRMGSIARALIANPLLLLCDEPTDGLAPVVIEQLFERLGRIVGAGTAILLAEQNLRFASGLAHRGYVIDKGRIRAAGALDQLMRNDKAIACHLAV